MLEGSYYNRLGELIEVRIGVNGVDGTIGDDETGVYFNGEEAVSTETQMNDTFDVLLCQQATVRLLCRDFVSGFFASNATDVSVKVMKSGECVFAGFVEPQAYSQDYSEELDEIELSCIDAITAFQYSKYRDIGSRRTYTAVKRAAARRSFAEVMQEIVDGVSEKLGEELVINYDDSKSLPGREASMVFDELKINELLFLGDSEDDVWQNDEVMKQLLQFLDLHMMQEGLNLYVFDWGSLKNHHFGGVDVEINSEIAVGDDHKLSVGETYNQIRVKCDVKAIETVIESPLDGDGLVSPYSNMQKYMTEYASDGEGKSAFNAFNAMVSGGWTDYDAAKVTEWFVQVRNNVHWRFNIDGEDAIKKYCSNGEYQQRIVNALREKQGAALLSWGKVERTSTGSDNAPVSKVEMTNYLFMSVNGNGQDGAESYPQPEDIKANIPYASYEGHVSGGVFSPADDDTTNYIVVSGKIGLNPLMRLTGDYADLRTQGASFGNTVPSRTNDDGRYYTQQWWKSITPHATAESDDERRAGLVPWTDDCEQGYEFKYSAVGESVDKVSKVAVVACMLVIGDKCVVETGTEGQIGDFEWRRYKRLEECGSEDEYYQQCFYVGFDPKIGDKLIGTMFGMQNNIDYTLGIDAEGIAIPIRKSDNVSGGVEFKILGPVNTVWSEVTRRHATFFRHTHWGENAVPLLAHVSSIVIEEFEVKVYSDNGLVKRKDKDLVYVSDTSERFVNKKDDIEWKVNSTLTGSDCRKLGVSNGVKMSSPADAIGEGVVEITDHVRNRTEKPEKLYVDSYWEEYHEPRVSLETTLEDREGIVSVFNLYRHPAIGKTFFVEGISRDVDNAAATLKLKEI